MPRKYASGHKAWFICQRCGQRGLYRLSMFDGYFPNLRVHPECWEDKHPQENLPKVSDPIALWRPSPEFGGVAPVLTGILNVDQSELSWTEAEIFNARYESYDVYRATLDTVTGQFGDFSLIVSLPITYDEFMAITSQTLTYIDTEIFDGRSYNYYVVANASNGAGDPDGDFSQQSNIVTIETAQVETFFRLLESGELRLMEDSGARLLEGAP